MKIVHRINLLSIIEVVFWTVIFLFWYKSILFTKVFSLTYDESIRLLLLMVGIYVIYGILCCIRDDKYQSYIWLGAGVPYGIYSILAYYKYYMAFLMVIGIIIIMLSVLVNYFLFSRDVINMRRKREICKRRVYNGLLFCKRSVVIGLWVFITFIAIRVLLSGNLLKSNIEVTNSYGEQYTISNNMDMLLKLQPDEWEKLDVQEKLDVCQCIANIEGNYLGISHELNVGSKFLENDTLGYYMNRTHQIIIDLECLETKSSVYILEIVCHEAYHAYSHALCDMYQNLDDKDKNLLLFRSTKQYIEEFSDYKEAEEDLYAYIDQLCEQDAYEYGTDAAKDYMWRIYDYLEMGEIADFELYYKDLVGE